MGLNGIHAWKDKAYDESLGEIELMDSDLKHVQGGNATIAQNSTSRVTIPRFGCKKIKSSNMHIHLDNFLHLHKHGEVVNLCGLDQKLDRLDDLDKSLDDLFSELG
jgi:hypothetical protein